MLPPLSADEERHSAALAELIRGQLGAAGGWLSFERFMELALYAPGLGYYSAGSTKIGSGGDFVTAPEVSGLFSRCVARQCAQVLAATGGDILELGAGTGRLAAGILSALAQEGPLPERYLILEVSADLAARQRALLAALPAGLRARVVWLERLPPAPMRGVLLANEVADALPCRRFVYEGGAVRELGVSARCGAAPFTMRGGRPTRSCGAPARPSSRSWMRRCPRATSRKSACASSAVDRRAWPSALQAGAILLFDYGLPRRHYYHPQRAQRHAALPLPAARAR